MLREPDTALQYVHTLVIHPSTQFQTVTDESSSHPSLATAQLDWTDALTDSGIPAVQALLQEASADLILGADVVRPCAS